MVPGFPFRELAQINNDFIRLDGTYSHVMVQRRIVQYNPRYALVLFESLAAPKGPHPKLVFAIEVWEKCRWTDFWKRLSSVRVQRKYLPTLMTLQTDLLDEDPYELQRQGVARMQAEIDGREPGEYPEMEGELPFGFVNSL